MREERKKEETRRLNKIRGYEEYTYEKDDEEEIEEEKEVKKEKEASNKTFSFKRLLVRIVLIIIIILVYAIQIEPKLLFKVNEIKVNVDKLDESLNGLKIVQFADIHYGNTIGEKELDKIVNKINEIKPDIVVFTGDLLDNSIKLNDKNKKLIVDKLSKIEAKLYKYAIFGDNDYKDKDNYIDILNSSNFVLLNNNYNIVYDEINNPIYIIGINKYDNNDYTFIDSIDNTSLKIILDHEPDNINNYKDKNIDIIFNSHTLGGLVRIPFIGGIINNSKYNDSYTEIGNTLIYNSNGLGTENIKLRFLNVPSINLYRIYK